MLSRLLVPLVGLVSSVWADTVLLRNGAQVTGAFVGADSREVRLAVGSQVRAIPIQEISQIRFGSAPGAATPAAASAAVPLRAQPASPATPFSVPVGTIMAVRMVDNVDSERDQPGQTFRASLDEAVTVDGQVAIPRGAPVVLRLTEEQQSGRFKGKSVLTLDMVSVTVRGRTVGVSTAGASVESKSRGSRTAKMVGGGAALGATIGAMAGGGGGAAIGAASGAGAGAAAQVFTRGQRVRIPSESRMQFRLQRALSL